MSLIRRNDPEHPVIRLQDEMNSLFRQFFRDPFLGDNFPILSNRDLTPRINVEETATEYIIQAEVPGIDPKDVEVQLHGNTLTIMGQKKEQEERAERHMHIREHRYGTFQRSMVLPDAANMENIKATSKHGVLTLTVPKKEEKQPKRIQINEDTTH